VSEARARYPALVRRLAAAVLVAIVAVSCGNGTTRELQVRVFDAGSDATVDASGGDAAIDDAGSDADPNVGGPCVDDAQCDDGVACTFDACDKTISRCRNVPDDARCDDGKFCNGRETCVRAHGCEPGPVVTCEDGDSCTIDSCVEATQSCAHVPRDQDGDGDPDDHCVAKHDCNDLDPTVSSTHAEVCANHKDDNCNGVVDEAACVTVSGDTCASPVAIAGGGTYSLSTVGANKDFSSSCSVTSPSASRDVVAAITVPAGANKDLDVWLSSTTSEVSLALRSSCAQPSSELACASATGATAVRARARNVPPGTYYAIVTTQVEAQVELKVALLDPTTKPTNEDCASAAPIAPGAPVAVSIIDPSKDLASACNPPTGELTYALTLAQAADVRVYASTTSGTGQPIIGLRAPHCTDAADELRCRVGSALPLFARNVAAGTYVITVAGTSQIDASVDVEIAAPTQSPPNETCTAPPAATVNVTSPIDLSQHDDAIQDGCFPGVPTAALDLSLAVPSDVLLVGRFSLTEQGSVSLDAPACTLATRLACNMGRTPVRASKRGVPAGDYRIVVSDSAGLVDSITPLVRAAVPPTTIAGGDACPTVFDIPQTGGFFVGDTTNKGADFSNPCDTPSQPPGGAPDQIGRLVLTQPQRVVLSMDGSAFTTILDVRQGTSCPGAPIQDDCYVGYESARSFLDLELQAGTYFIVIDGYAGQKGAWNLDVRVLPP
jgi:hypothetical protein